MIWTPPLATPRSTDAVTPNSNAASTIFSPAVSSCRWKKPPPPKMPTDSRNGCGRSDTLKSSDGRPSRNGSVSAGAEADILEREDANGDRRQREREAGADARWATIEARPSPNRSGGIALRSSSTNCQIAGERQRVLRIELDLDVRLLTGFATRR